MTMMKEFKEKEQAKMPKRDDIQTILVIGSGQLSSDKRRI